jgi:hypothetical protein
MTTVSVTAVAVIELKSEKLEHDRRMREVARLVFRNAPLRTFFIKFSRTFLGMSDPPIRSPRFN